MANFLVSDPGEFIAIDPKTGEEKFRAKTSVAIDANREWGDKIDSFGSQTDNLSVRNAKNKRNKKYPINELYYLRYDLWGSDEAGERRHPCEVIKALGGKELRFEGCPMGDCDYILAQFDKNPSLPSYIKDISTDKEEKDRIRKEFSEFILEE